MNCIYINRIHILVVILDLTTYRVVYSFKVLSAMLYIAQSCTSIVFIIAVNRCSIKSSPFSINCFFHPYRFCECIPKRSLTVQPKLLDVQCFSV